jgi:hypothetical protein
MGYAVFLSHASQDREIAEDIKSEITRFDVAVYMYEHDVQPGTSLPAKLVAQVQAADALVVLLSEHGKASPTVNQEIGLARGSGKLIIPLLEKGVDIQTLTLLQGLEWLAWDRGKPEVVKRAVADYLENQRRGKAKAGMVAAVVIGGLLLWANSGE